MSLTAAHAASLTWDGNGATAPNPDGGAGTWDVNTTANWWDGASNVVWPALGGTDDDAVFANTAGTVSLAAGGVTANDLTFSSTGYLIQSNTLTLNGTTPTLTTDPGVTATINSLIAAPAGLVKSGDGTLVLGGANAYTGATTINAGTLEVKLSGGYTTTSSGYAVASGAAFTFTIPGVGYDGNLSSPLSGAGTVNLVNNGYSMHLNANNGSFTGTLTTSGNSTLFLDIPSATSASTAYVIDMNNGGGAYGSLCTMGVASGSTINLGSLTGTTPTSKICSGYNGSGTITWSIGALGTDTTFGGYFANYAMTTALTKVGSGKLTLTGANTYTGGTTINQGTLELVKATAFGSNVAFGATNVAKLQLSSPLAGDAWTFAKQLTGGSTNARLEKAGLGTLTLTPAASSSFVGSSTGALTVSEGTLNLTAAFDTAPAVSIAGGARFASTSTVGNVMVANGGTLEGGIAGSGTLTAADVTLGSVSTDTATLKGTLSTTVGYTPLAVANLTLNGGNNSVTLDASGLGLSTGTYYDVLVSTNAITAPNASSVAAVFKSTSRSYTPNVDGSKVRLYYDVGATVYWTGAASTAWDSAATNWKLSGDNSDTQFMAGDVVFFHDSPTNSTVDISSGNVSPGAVTFDNTTTTAYTLQGSNGIASGSLTKSGNGMLTIANANSYSGGTTLNAGTLNLNNAAALGSGALVINGGVLDNTSTAPITLTTNNAQTWGGNLVFTGSYDLNLGGGAVSMTASRDVSVTAGTLTVGGAIGGTGPLTKSGAGTLVLGGINTYSGGTSIDAGTLTLDYSARSGWFKGVGTFTIGAAGNLELRSGTTTSADSTAFYDDGTSTTFNGSGTITKTGLGYLAFALLSPGITGFTGLIDIQQGILGTNTNNWGPGLMDLNIAAGAVLDMRTGTVNIDALDGAGMIYKTWTSASTLTLGNSDGSGSFSGSINPQAGAGPGTGGSPPIGMVSLVKNGSGTQTLSGANTYTGTTTVNGGTLALTGSATMASPTMTVASGATLAMAGDATVATTTTITLAEGALLDTSGLTADFTLASGQTLNAGRTSGFAEDVAGNLVLSDGTLNIGGAGSIAGTFTQTGTLTLGGGGAVKFDLAATDTLGDGVNDLIAVTGDLALVDTTTINVNKLSGSLSAGSYTLMSWTGSLTGTVADNLTLGLSNIGRQSYGLAQSGNSVVLNVAGLPADLAWAGADYSNPTYWDQNTTANWVGGPDGKFADGDHVTFSDSATATIVDVRGTMTPVSVTFSNTTAKPYTLGGIGSIDGATGITKSGNGLVTITNDNTMSGAVALNGGITSIASGDGLGTGAITFDGGTLAFTGTAAAWSRSITLNAGGGGIDITAAAGTLTATGTIAGAGALTKAGDGTLVLGAPYSHTGATTVTAGTLELRLAAGYNTTSSGFDVAAGAALTFNMPTAGYDGGLVSPLSGTGTVNLVNNGYSLHLNADNSAFAGTLTTSGGSTLFIDTPSATNANTAYVVNMTGWPAGYGGMCTMNVANGSTMHLGSLSGTNPSSKIASGYAGPGTITWSVGALGTDTTFAGYFGDFNMVTALTKVGTGKLTLAGVSTFTGNVSVDGGKLIGAANRSGSNTAFGLASTARSITVNVGATLEFQVPNLFGGHSTTSAPTLVVNQGTVTNADPLATNVVNNGLTNLTLNSGTLTSTAGNGVIDDIDGTTRPGEVYGAWGLNGTVTSTGTSLISTSAPGVAGRVLLGSGMDTTFAVTSGTLTVAATLQAGDSSYLGGLIKTGAGKIVLSAVNVYSSPTLVNEGTLELTGSLVAASGVTVPSNITVASGATLAGSGTATGTLAVAGSVAPGTTGVGALSVGATTLSGTYACDLAGTTADSLAITGNLNLTGATLAVTEVTPATAPSYVIATYTGSLTGTFATVPAGYLVDTATTGQIKLVKSAGGYSDWADSWTGPVLSDKTPGGDPDGDGISNVMEYVIGGDPRVSSTSYLPGQAIVGTDLVLSYERSDASETDTTQTGQWSTNLTDWNDIAPVLVSENAADPDSMEIRIPLTNAVGGKLFGRLNVTKP